MQKSLRQTQSYLFDYILGKQVNVDRLIADGGPIDKQIRLGIYSNTYVMRLRSVIDTDHELLSFYLGDDLFNQLVQGYINTHPSAHTSLRQYC